MQVHFLQSLFLIIGLSIGIILSLQIRAKPIGGSSFPLKKLENQRALLATFKDEQDLLRKKLDVLQEKRAQAQRSINQRSSRETKKRIEHLKTIASLTSLEGRGVRITLDDNRSVTRIDFSSYNENFVQSSHLRDLVNLLFVKYAAGVAINGRRVTPLTPVQSVFDTILIGNFQVTPPFVVEAVGNPDTLTEAANLFRKNKKMRIFIDTDIPIVIAPLDGERIHKYLSLFSS